MTGINKGGYFVYKVIIVIFILLFHVISLSAQTDPIVGKGQMRIDLMPEIHVIANSPASGWSATNNGLDKVFKKSPGHKEKLNITHGEYLFTDLWFVPITGLKLNAGIEMTVGYADTFYQPINMEHRIQKEYFDTFSKEELERGIDLKQIGERIRLWKAKIEYKNNSIYSRISTGYGHAGWAYEGDVFGFYPEQWDIINYRRISGKPVPTAFETDWNMRFKNTYAGKLSVAAGPEPIWGNGISYYAKYTYKIGVWLPTLLFKHESIEWGLPDEHIWALALTSKYYGLFRVPLEAGLLFQPFRVHKNYTRTTKTTAGMGYYQSDYVIEKKSTGYQDAFGFLFKGNTDLIPFMNKTTFTYTYLGKITGNMHKFDLELEKKFQTYYSIYWQNIYRFPVEDSEVLILEGTGPLSPGQAITEPRSRDDPFWVNSKNRKAFISSFTFIFDPAPASWIFKYYPNLVELWNLNQNKSTPFSFIINYKLSYYPGTTDLEYYRNSNNDILWPGEYDTTKINRYPYPIAAGAWPMKRPIHFLTLVGEFSVSTKGLIICFVKLGEEIATCAIAYLKETYELIPMTKMFNPSITFASYPFYVNAEYGQNVWGPEQWYKDLGAVIDRLYKVSFKYNFTKNHEVELQYTGTREVDNQYLVNKIVPYDEIQLSYKARFSTRFTIIPPSTGSSKEEEIEDSQKESNKDTTDIIDDLIKDNESKSTNNDEDIDSLIK